MYQIIFFVFLSSAYAQLTLPGTCENGTLSTAPILNMTIVGTWHEVERTPNNIESGQCATITFSYQNSSANPFSISNREIVNKTVQYHNGTIVEISSDMTLAKVNFTDFQLDLRVLASDFNNYAVLYSCKNGANNTRSVLAWKLSRNITLSSTSVTAINTAIQNTDLQNASWTSISHTEEACKVNAASTIYISTLTFIVAMYSAM